MITYGHDAVVGYDVVDDAAAGDAIQNKRRNCTCYWTIRWIYPLKWLHLPAAAAVDDDVAAVGAADGPLELVVPLCKKKNHFQIKRESLCLNLSN